MEKNFILISIAFIFSFFIKNAAEAQINQQDSLALVNLYDSTMGNTFWLKNTNWLTQEPVSTWYGVTVADNRVIQLVLRNNHLFGICPHSLGNLSRLTVLDLSSNNIADTIPAELGNLTQLINLNLSYNGFKSSIPPELGNLTELTNLELELDELTGNIPPELGKLTKLTKLDFGNNKLSGSLPPELGNLSNIISILLDDNTYLSGSIPSTFGNLTNIQTLNLNNSQLSGEIPSTLGNLSNLTDLDLSGNNLSGNIPPTLGNNSNLTYLYLNFNKLTGNIPSSLANLKNLTGLSLDNNQLTGSIPSEFSNFTNLLGLTLNNNFLSGIIPAGLSHITNIYLDVSYNQYNFTGTESLVNPSATFIYAPQANVKLHYINNILSVSAGGTLSNNTYSWYKDSKFYKSVKGDSTLITTESGKYYVIVTNTISTQLTLHSDTVDTNVLPLTLVSFTATKQNNQTLLQWTTANEINTDYFSVERNKNNTNFTSLGIVPSTGNSNKNNYSFTDDLSLINTQPSTIFYRLKMVDKDGTCTYSEIKNITLDNYTNSKLYPNPTKENSLLFFNAKGNYTVTISDVSGKIVQLKKGVSTNNENRLELTVSNLASGIYWITIVDETNKKQTLQLNKQ